MLHLGIRKLVACSLGTHPSNDPKLVHQHSKEIQPDYHSGIQLVLQETPSCVHTQRHTPVLDHYQRRCKHYCRESAQLHRHLTAGASVDHQSFLFRLKYLSKCPACEMYLRGWLHPAHAHLRVLSMAFVGRIISVCVQCAHLSSVHRFRHPNSTLEHPYTQLAPVSLGKCLLAIRTVDASVLFSNPTLTSRRENAADVWTANVSYCNN